MNNSRRKLIQNLLFLSPAAYLAACESSDNTNAIKSTSDKYPKFKLKMVTSFPKNLPDTDIPAQRLAKKIEQMSLGKIKIIHYAAGELVPAFEVFDAVREKVADCAYTAPIYWLSKNKAISFFGCLSAIVFNPELTSKLILDFLARSSTIVRGPGQNLSIIFSIFSLNTAIFFARSKESTCTIKGLNVGLSLFEKIFATALSFVASAPKP